MTAPRSFLFAGGGTAGHLLPGIAVAEALVERGHPPSSIHFVGSDRGVEAQVVPAAGFTLDELPGRGIQRRLTLANIAAAIGIVSAVFQAFGIVRRRRPSVGVPYGVDIDAGGTFYRNVGMQMFIATVRNPDQQTAIGCAHVRSHPASAPHGRPTRKAKRCTSPSASDW